MIANLAGSPWSAAAQAAVASMSDISSASGALLMISLSICAALVMSCNGARRAKYSVATAR